MTSVSSTRKDASSLTLTEAVAHITRHALRPGVVGRIGIELEAHVIDLAEPGRRVPWPTLQAVVAVLPDLPGGSRVTLEPGGQIELSGPPMAGAEDAVDALRADHAVLSLSFNHLAARRVTRMWFRLA